MHKNRDWTVLLLGGASGSGKSSISYPLAQLYGVSVLEVDDFQALLETMTTAEMFPAIHYWETHPDWKAGGPEPVVGQLIDVGRELAPGLTAVVDNHLETDMPVILEGDFILPEFAAAFSDARVKSVFIHEPEREQILRNYLQREPEEGPQQFRAEVSWRYGNWLAARCAKLGLPVLESRPWRTALRRLMEL